MTRRTCTNCGALVCLCGPPPFTLDSLRAELKTLEDAIDKHRADVWGAKRPEHHCDLELYHALRRVREGREESGEM